jgi:hypothetical protein
MAAAPLAALDLPLKVLGWAAELSNETQLHRAECLGQSVRCEPELAARLAGTDEMTSAAIAR